MPSIVILKSLLSYCFTLLPEKAADISEQAVNIFSDDESADEEEEDSSEDNWMSQVPTFLQEVRDRYTQRQK